MADPDAYDASDESNEEEGMEDGDEENTWSLETKLRRCLIHIVRYERVILHL